MGKKAFGGKVVDLKKSGLWNVTIGEMMNDKRQIAPTEVVGAFWKMLRTAELQDQCCYFGTPDEIGHKLSKGKVTELKAKLR